jgi:hypothetical protein
MLILWITTALVPLLWAFGLSTYALGTLVYYAMVFAAMTVAIQLTAVMAVEVLRNPKANVQRPRLRTSIA